MTDFVYYVDPNVASGGDGSTGNPWSGLAEAVTEIGVLDLTAGHTLEILCRAGTEVVAAAVNFQNITDGPSNFLTIRADAGHEHLGVFGAGYVLEGSASGGQLILGVANAYTVIEDIEINGTTTFSGRHGLFINGAANPKFRRLLVTAGSSTGSNGIDAAGGNLDGIEIDSCLVHDCGGIGINSPNYCEWTIKNTLSINNGLVGINRGGTNTGVMTAHNCVTYGNGGDDFSPTTHVTGTGNYSEDATAASVNTAGGGTGIQETVFVDYAGGNYDPAPGGTLDGGGESGVAPSLDIARQSFNTPPSAGPKEVAGGGSTPPTVDAGPDKSGPAGQATALEGSWSAGSGSSHTVLWTNTTDGTGTFSNSSSPTSSFTPVSGGPYTLQLSVDPDDGDPVVDTLTFTVSTDASLTVQDISNNTGTTLANETGVEARVYNASTGDLVVVKPGLTSDANGDVLVTDALLVAATEYYVQIILASGAYGWAKEIAT